MFCLQAASKTFRVSSETFAVSWDLPTASTQLIGGCLEGATVLPLSKVEETSKIIVEDPHTVAVAMGTKAELAIPSTLKGPHLLRLEKLTGSASSRWNPVSLWTPDLPLHSSTRGDVELTPSYLSANTIPTDLPLISLNPGNEYPPPPPSCLCKQLLMHCPQAQALSTSFGFGECFDCQRTCKEFETVDVKSLFFRGPRTPCPHPFAICSPPLP